MSEEKNTLWLLDDQIVCLECMLNPEHEWPKNSFAEALQADEDSDSESPQPECFKCGFRS